MPSEDRDQLFERALARHLPSASPDSACPDAETLAAYQASTLSAEETGLWKQHIAGCERCQEILSLVAQTEDIGAEVLEQQDELVPLEAHYATAAIAARASAQPFGASPPMPAAAAVSSSQVTRFRNRPRWRWLVPVGAIAAGLIVWIGVSEHRSQRLEQTSEVQVAQNRDASAPATVTRSRDEAQLEKKLEAEPPAQSLRAAAPRTALTAPPKVDATKSTSPPSPATEELPRRKKDAMESDRASNGELQTPPLAETYVEKSRAVENAPEVPSAPPAAAAPAAHQNSVSAKAEAQVAKQAAGVQTAAVSGSTSEVSAQIVTRLRDNLDLVQLASGDPRYVVAPGEAHAWRLGALGRIERSTDRGKTWKLQNSGVTAELTAGSATSDKVCWVVGKSGTLLLTTDGGKHWKALTSPIYGDIGGIHATDALHASIWDVPNRQSYQTSDGGVTWSRTANE